jgi:hypothetical protein
MPPGGIRRALGAGAIAAMLVGVAACGSGGSRSSSGSHPSDAPATTIASPSAKHASERAAAKHAKTKAKARAGGSATGTAATGAQSVTVAGETLTNGTGATGSSGGTSSGGTTHVTTHPTTPTTVYVPKPYDPSKPIDLGGVPGVTPEQQARAEQLVRDTLRDLPKWADPNVAYAAGYRSIGDGFTGDEHYVNWSYVNDSHILDSHFPESLVYETRNGKKTLVAAMYMMPFGSRFTDAPDVGGALTQWHVHSDLCLRDDPSDPSRKIVFTLVNPDAECPAGSSKAGNTPMLHVWIVSNKCGPFAALDGIGGGQIPDGETKLCDTVHGG